MNLNIYEQGLILLKFKNIQILALKYVNICENKH